MNRFIPFLCSLCLWSGGVSHALVQEKTFGYFDCSFAGKDDALVQGRPGGMDWTAAQMDCVGRALNTWMDILGATGAPTRNIRIVFIWDSKNTALASTGTLWKRTETLTTGSQTYKKISCAAEALWRDHYVDPSSDNAGRYDMKISLSMINNSSGYYYFGENPSKIASYQTDAQTMLLHEIAHGLGFTTNSGGWVSNEFSSWDLMMKRAENGVSILDDPNKKWQAGDTFYAGTENIPVYNPSSGASSMSHLDLIEGLMKPAISTGKTQRVPTDSEIKLLNEMGWTIGPVPDVPSVPEPGTSVLMLTGAMVLLTGRRRRRE